jgi:hypothetical protein
MDFLFTVILTHPEHLSSPPFLVEFESHNSRRRAKQTGNAKEKTTQSWRKDPKACQYMKSLKIPKGNQNPHIEEEQTTQSLS